MAFNLRDHAHRRVEIFDVVLDSLEASGLTNVEIFYSLYARGTPCIGPNWGAAYVNRLFLLDVYSSTTGAIISRRLWRLVDGTQVVKSILT